MCEQGRGHLICIGVIYLTKTRISLGSRLGYRAELRTALGSRLDS
jgi:hypothetical protein